MTLGEIASLVSGNLVGAPADTTITGVAPAGAAAPGDLTFFANPRYLAALRQSRASAAFVPEDFAETIAPARIHVAKPSVAFAEIAARFAPAPVRFTPGIDPKASVGSGVEIGAEVCVQACAVIAPGARIGARTVVGAGCYIGHDARIGEDCLVYPNVTIRERCRLGNRVILHSGAVIGSDGFGFELVEGRHRKIPQIGIVQIDDDVEIGANVTIDRARFGRTWIQEGAKIDNLVQLAHNVVVGKHSIIVAQVGISGSTELGAYVTLAGQVGLAGHIKINDRAIVGAQGGVSKDIPPGEIWWGSPAAPIKETKERLALTKRLPKLLERIKILEQEVENLRDEKATGR
jgi:UDP-3-O-[3-hydroxymyristoyl] glucosamine N-acyltransferase